MSTEGTPTSRAEYEADLKADREAYEKRRNEANNENEYYSTILISRIFLVFAWISAIAACVYTKSLWPICAAIPVHLLALILAVLCDIAARRR